MNIQEWIVANPGGDGDPAVRQAVFVRDLIGGVLFPATCPPEVPIEVVGEHRSKSVTLPVCLSVFGRRGGGEVALRFRNNWYNWAISVESSAPIDDVGGWGLFDEGNAIWAVLWPRWSGACPCAVEASLRVSRGTRRALWGR